jgi:hypothetical protein
MANVIYNIAKQAVSTAMIDFSTADLRVMLTSGYTPSIENDNYVSAVESYETSGTGYYRQQLSNVTLTRDTINNREVLDADDVIWASANFSATGAIIFDNDTNILITYLGFSTTGTSQNTPYKIIWSVEGILQLR